MSEPSDKGVHLPRDRTDFGHRHDNRGGHARPDRRKAREGSKWVIKFKILTGSIRGPSSFCLTWTASSRRKKPPFGNRISTHAGLAVFGGDGSKKRSPTLLDLTRPSLSFKRNVPRKNGKIS